jgi:Cadherin-like beta sandwich domain
MRHHPSKQNIVWTLLFSLLATLALSACGDSNNVSGPPAPIPLSPDAKLSSLTVNPGPLQPVFSSDGVNYTVDVLTSVTSVTVAAQPQTAGATVNINGQATTNRSVTLGAAGSITVVTIVVTAPSGSQNTYIVTVNRAAPGGNNNLKTLTVTSGTLSPPFAAPGISGFPGYTVAVASGVASVTVTAQAQDAGAGATVSINNQTTTSLLVLLGTEGSSTLVTIEVTAPNGNPKNYFVTVDRAALNSNAGLSNLQVSTGTLSPLFAAPGISGLPGYTVAVPNATTSITVTAVKADPNATLTITPSATVNNLPVGNTVFTIEVTALNGNQKTYFVTVNRLAPLSNNADLSALEVFAGAAATPPALALTPSPFSSATTSYTTAEVDNTVTQVTIVATRADPNATMTIGGVPSTGQTTVNIGDPGSTTQILIVVTPPSGPADAKTYTVDVPKAS